jgi:hypothetical protein
MFMHRETSAWTDGHANHLLFIGFLSILEFSLSRTNKKTTEFVFLAVLFS